MTDKANISRRIESLMAKANHTDSPAEAKACREKAEELRSRYGIKEPVPGPLVTFDYWTPPDWVNRNVNFDDLIPDEYQYDSEDGDW